MIIRILPVKEGGNLSVLRSVQSSTMTMICLIKSSKFPPANLLWRGGLTLSSTDLLFLQNTVRELLFSDYEVRNYCEIRIQRFISLDN